jgi:hypothetical protein
MARVMWLRSVTSGQIAQPKVTDEGHADDVHRQPTTYAGSRRHPEASRSIQ